ncbi:hypothetical protein ES708_25109 [subsurface metagenome]
MKVIQTYKENAGEFSGLTSAIEFEDCRRRLRLYFKDIGGVKARLINGEKISMPYLTLQKDRRIKNIKVKDERRRPVSELINN